MKSIVNEIYNCPIAPALRGHLLNDLGFSAEDKKIIESLIDYNGDSNFHYENTGIPKDKFERRLRNVNYAICAELIRMSNAYMRERT